MHNHNSNWLLTGVTLLGLSGIMFTILQSQLAQQQGDLEQKFGHILQLLQEKPCVNVITEHHQIEENIKPKEENEENQRRSVEEASCGPSLALVGPAAGWTGKFEPNYPTYSDLRRELFGEGAVYEDFPNYYFKEHSGSPNTYISAAHIEELWNIKPPKFVVEVGSFVGGSSILFGEQIRKQGYQNVALLCIDTWLGDLNMWLNKAENEHMAIRWGRPTVWDQWVINVMEANLTDIVLPFSTTSLIGARWLKAHNYLVDFVYVDSAHEIDETYMELELYWDLLAPGGILAGDDFNWEAVEHDVSKFAKQHNLEIRFVTERHAGGPWYLIKG